jgi:hypothetical protein
MLPKPKRCSGNPPPGCKVEQIAFFGAGFVSSSSVDGLEGSEELVVGMFFQWYSDLLHILTQN